MTANHTMSADVTDSAQVTFDDEANMGMDYTVWREKTTLEQSKKAEIMKIKEPDEIDISVEKLSPATDRFKELTDCYQDDNTKAKYEKKEFERWYYDFVDIDANADGLIMKDEFMTWIKLKETDNFNDKKAQKMWDDLLKGNIKKDGAISWDEFILQMVKSGYLKAM